MWRQGCEAACSHPGEQETEDLGGGVKPDDIIHLPGTHLLQQGPFTSYKFYNLPKQYHPWACVETVHIQTTISTKGGPVIHSPNLLSPWKTDNQERVIEMLCQLDFSNMLTVSF